MKSLYLIFVNRLLCVLALFALSGCVSHVQTTVSTYRGEAGLPLNAKLFIQPLADTPTSFDELEFRYFANRLAAQLESAGFDIVAREPATHILTLQYDNQRQEKNSDRTRLRVHGGLGYRYGYGSVVVFDKHEYDQYEFARRLRIGISTNNDQREQVLSLAAVSYGACEHLSSVFDEMVAAVLENFDSPNGSINPVKVATNKPCLGKR